MWHDALDRERGFAQPPQYAMMMELKTFDDPMKKCTEPDRKCGEEGKQNKCEDALMGEARDV